MLDDITMEDGLFKKLGSNRLSQFANSWKLHHDRTDRSLAHTLLNHSKYHFEQWTKLSETIRSLSMTVEKSDFDQLCLSGQKFLRNNSIREQDFGFNSLRIAKTVIFDARPTESFFANLSDRNKLRYASYEHPDHLFTSRADLIIGLIEKYITLSKEYFYVGYDEISFDVEVMMIEKIVQFTQLWETGLGLQLDVEFLKQLLIHISKVMTLPYGIRCDRFTQHVKLPQLKKGTKLYFAYGSNMDEAQMRVRCPNSTVAGLASLANFQFFINDRGVASIRPSLGETCHGLLWNIDDQDWASLDHYEGVKYNYYNRLTAKIQLNERTTQTVTLENFTDCEIYVATHTSEGTPRYGYLKKIMNAVNKWSSDEINHFSKKDPEDFGCVVSELDHGRNLWIKELNSWKNGD